MNSLPSYFIPWFQKAYRTTLKFPRYRGFNFPVGFGTKGPQRRKFEEKDFERIFLLFQTLAPKDQVESTGVGLTVAQKIVEMYGGRIWVESKVGTGSTFFFTIPIMKEITPAPASREAAGEAVSASHK